MKGPDTKNQIPSRSKSFFPHTPFSVLLLSLALLPPVSLQAASTGNVALFTPAGSGASASQGAYVSADNGLDTYYSYFIEVPPGLANLYVAVFDGDVGRGGTAEASPGRDRQRGSSWDTSCNYRLLRPNGTEQGNVTLSANWASRSYENAWVNFSFANPVASPAAGHWELRVNMSSSVTGGDDINAFGIRAHDGDAGSGGTELNVYFHSFTNIGAQEGTYSTRNYTLYPYITSGSTGFFNDWDWDVDLGGNMGSVNLTSPSGLFTQNITPLSNNNAWRQNSYTGWCDLGGTSQGLPAGHQADDYGLWTASITAGIGTQTANYQDIYMGGFGLGTPPPTAQPQANTFRVYLPTDAGTAPVKPFIRQWLDHRSGPNPPQVGQTTIIRVTIQVVNPTPHAITFSTSNLVSGFVPNNGSTTYGGNAFWTQGSVVVQPSVGGTGAITWNPGSVAGGTSAALDYQVRVRPASSGITIDLTGSPGTNGTQAVFVDETGNTTQTRATTTFGPICPLQVREGSGALLVDLVSFEAVVTGVNEPVLLRWETGAEFDNAGFNLHRAVAIGNGQYRTGQMLTEMLIPPLGDETRGAVYEFADPDPIKVGETRAYFLEDVDVMGVSTLHGPVFAQAPANPTQPDPSPTPTVTPSSPEPEIPLWKLDSDNDGYADWYEKQAGTNPFDADNRPALGDVNGDGQVNIEDAITLYSRVQTGEESSRLEETQRGDVNQDSRITVEDAIILYRWVLRAPDFLVLPHREK